MKRKIYVEIDLENAAFRDEGTDEVLRDAVKDFVRREVANGVERLAFTRKTDTVRLLDTNGNVVGTVVHGVA